MDGRIEVLEDRIYGYRFFSYVFLTLPDDAFVNQMLAYPEDDDSDGGKLIRNWAESCAGVDRAAVLQQVAVDRTQLFRGLTEPGPVPPYESLFIGAAKDNAAVNANVAQYYARIGFQQIGGVHDSPEYLGCELAFMDQVLTRELTAVREGDEASAQNYNELAAGFLRAHLGWAAAYTQEMEGKAKTDLYRGLALLLRSFISEERV